MKNFILLTLGLLLLQPATQVFAQDKLPIHSSTIVQLMDHTSTHNFSNSTTDANTQHNGRHCMEEKSCMTECTACKDCKNCEDCKKCMNSKDCENCKKTQQRKDCAKCKM